MERLAIKTTVSGGWQVIALTGPLTSVDSIEFQRVLQADSSALTIVDLSEVPYVDSAGIGVLVNAYVARDKTGRRLVLVGVRERVMNVLKMTRVHQFFQMYATVRDAVDGLEDAAAS